MSVATFAQALLTRWPGLPASEAEAETGGQPPRPPTGPVMMGDIHGSLGGRPVLLILWDEWAREVHRDPD